MIYDYYEITNPELIRRCKEMMTDGNDYDTIAEELNISTSEVYDILTEISYFP